MMLCPSTRRYCACTKNDNASGATGANRRGGATLGGLFGRLFRARLGRGAAGCARGGGLYPLTFEVGFAALAFDDDPVLLTHEAVAIGRERVGRNSFPIVPRPPVGSAFSVRICAISVLLFRRSEDKTIPHPKVVVR